AEAESEATKDGVAESRGQTKNGKTETQAVPTKAAVGDGRAEVGVTERAIIGIVEIPVVGAEAAVLSVAVVAAGRVIEAAGIAVVPGVRPTEGAIEQAIALR